MSAQLFGKKKDAPPSAEETLEALAASKEAIQDAIEEVVNETKQSVMAAVEEAKQAEKEKEAIRQKEKEDTVQEEAALMLADIPSEERKLRPEVRPHAFVVMPFGIKKGFDGMVINFNAIYQDLIKPALVEAGFEPFRADEETTTGDILTDMFRIAFGRSGHR